MRDIYDASDLVQAVHALEVERDAAVARLAERDLYVRRLVVAVKSSESLAAKLDRIQRISEWYARDFWEKTPSSD